MTISPEQLAAYADGELDEITAARVRRAVEGDPHLASDLAQLTELHNMLAARFDPILAEPVPERLSSPIEDAAKVSIDRTRQRADAGYCGRRTGQPTQLRSRRPGAAQCERGKNGG